MPSSVLGWQYIVAKFRKATKVIIRSTLSKFIQSLKRL